MDILEAKATPPASLLQQSGQKTGTADSVRRTRRHRGGPPRRFGGAPASACAELAACSAVMMCGSQNGAAQGSVEVGRMVSDRPRQREGVGEAELDDDGDVELRGAPLGRRQRL